MIDNVQTRGKFLCMILTWTIDNLVLFLKYVAWQVLLIFNFLYLFNTRFFLERFEYKINPRVLAESRVRNIVRVWQLSNQGNICCKVVTQLTRKRAEVLFCRL